MLFSYYPCLDCGPVKAADEPDSLVFKGGGKTRVPEQQRLGRGDRAAMAGRNLRRNVSWPDPAILADEMASYNPCGEIPLTQGLDPAPVRDKSSGSTPELSAEEPDTWQMRWASYHPCGEIPLTQGLDPAPVRMNCGAATAGRGKVERTIEKFLTNQQLVARASISCNELTRDLTPEQSDWFCRLLMKASDDQICK